MLYYKVNRKLKNLYLNFKNSIITTKKEKSRNSERRLLFDDTHLIIRRKIWNQHKNYDFNNSSRIRRSLIIYEEGQSLPFIYGRIIKWIQHIGFLTLAGMA